MPTEIHIYHTETRKSATPILPFWELFAPITQVSVHVLRMVCPKEWDAMGGPCDMCEVQTGERDQRRTRTLQER